MQSKGRTTSRQRELSEAAWPPKRKANAPPKSRNGRWAERTGLAIPTPLARQRSHPAPPVAQQRPSPATLTVAEFPWGCQKTPHGAQEPSRCPRWRGKRIRSSPGRGDRGQRESIRIPRGLAIEPQPSAESLGAAAMMEGFEFLSDAAGPSVIPARRGSQHAGASKVPMPLRRVFVDAVSAGRAAVTGKRAHHLARVARLRHHERVEVTDHERLYTARVAAVSGTLVEFTMEDEVDPPPSGRPITVLLSLVKFARFEWAVEKTTELGVTSILPLSAARCGRGLAAAAEKRVPRWRRLAEEAAQQARRMAPPRIEVPVDLDQAIDKVEDAACFILDHEGASLPLALAETADDPTREIVFLVGPEGGWSDHERKAAQRRGFAAASLGANILRTETAAVAAVAVAAGAWGGFSP